MNVENITAWEDAYFEQTKKPFSSFYGFQLFLFNKYYFFMLSSLWKFSMSKTLTLLFKHQKKNITLYIVCSIKLNRLAVFYKALTSICRINLLVPKYLLWWGGLIWGWKCQLKANWKLKDTKKIAVISAATAIPQSKPALSSPACIVEPGISQDFLEIHLFFYGIFHLAKMSASVHSINSHIVES